MQELFLRPSAHFCFYGFPALTSLILQNGSKNRMALKSMSVAKLRDLRGKVDAEIAQKVASRRRERETQLSALALMTLDRR